jgi:tetratricopeptide (TPR) repeat protein
MRARRIVVVQMYYVSRIAGVVALAALGLALWFSIVLARADAYFRAGTPEAVARAVEIAPRNTEYLALRALQLDYDGADSTAVTRKIAALNPYASAPRIKLGLAAEIRGDSSGAEKWLLDAARVDGQFEPQWTLANFYFRAGRTEEFWKWMRQALEISYGDRTPAFDLCWRVNAEETLRRAIPDRHEVAAAYLLYVLARPQPMIADVARRLARYRDASDLPLLYSACDQMLKQGNRAALEIWLLTGQPAPVGIFNGDFAQAPLNDGFDWRLVESRGVTHVNLDAPPGHRIVLSGQEPESCPLLGQWLSLGGGKRYRLQWESRTAGLKSPSGIAWALAGRRAAVAPSADWLTGEMTFTAPDSFNQLELLYERPVGESRAEGNIELRHVRVTEVAP